MLALGFGNMFIYFKISVELGGRLDSKELSRWRITPRITGILGCVHRLKLKNLENTMFWKPDLFPFSDPVIEVSSF
jgi:hypothetical protein